MAIKINADTSSGLKLISDTSGIVEIQNAGTTKLTVNSSGATVAGTLAATAVTGDGSGLTGITSGGLTLLKTVATSSGTTVVAADLALSTYKTLIVEFWSCSPDTTEDTSIRWANTGGTAQKLGVNGTNASQGYYGRVTHDLVNKYVWTNVFDRDQTTLNATMLTAQSAEVSTGVNSQITTSTTSLTFDWTSGQDFDAGQITIYGLK